MLPDPRSMAVHMHRDRDGYRFEVRFGDESLHEVVKPAATAVDAERRGKAWIKTYRDADARERCRLLGYHWSAVKKARGGK